MENTKKDSKKPWWQTLGGWFKAILLFLAAIGGIELLGTIFKHQSAKAYYYSPKGDSVKTVLGLTTCEAIDGEPLCPIPLKGKYWEKIEMFFWEDDKRAVRIVLNSYEHYNNACKHEIDKGKLRGRLLTLFNLTEWLGNDFEELERKMKKAKNEKEGEKEVSQEKTVVAIVTYPSVIKFPANDLSKKKGKPSGFTELAILAPFETLDDALEECRQRISQKYPGHRLPTAETQ